MKKLEVFDPALCCSTGVCGPSPDQRLAAFAAVLKTFAGKLEVHRYNLAQEPAAFAANAGVQKILADEGPGALPICLIDGKLALKGVYPSADQLAQLLQIDSEACCSSDSDCCSEEDEANASGGCCEPEPKSATSCCSDDTCC